MQNEEKKTWDLRKRTKTFALDIIRLYGDMPARIESQVIGKQFLRSGTSVGAQYREACRAKSAADFVSKMEGSLQELEETRYWLELVLEVPLVTSERVSPLLAETTELVAIFVSSVKKAKESR